METRTYMIKKEKTLVAIQRIAWSFENTGILTVETYDTNNNLLSKERISLNIIKRNDVSSLEAHFPRFSVKDKWVGAFSTVINDEMVVYGNHVSTFFLPLFYVPEKDNRIFSHVNSELIPFFAKVLPGENMNELEYKTIMPEISYRYYDSEGILVKMYDKEYHIEVTDGSC